MDRPLEPDELELGEDVTHLFRRSTSRPGLVVSVRLTAEEADRLDEAADAAGVTIIEFAKNAMLAGAAQPAADSASRLEPARRRSAPRRGRPRPSASAPSTA